MKRRASVALLGTIALGLAAMSAQAARPDAGYYSHPTRSYGIAGYLYFSVITGGEGANEEYLSVIKRSTRVDDQTAGKFLQYATSSMADFKNYRLQARDSILCSKRSEISSIPQLASAFDSLDEALEARRESMTRGSEKILGADGMRNFETYLSLKDPEAKAATKNSEAALIATHRTPDQLISQYCSLN